MRNEFRRRIRLVDRGARINGFSHLLRGRGCCQDALARLLLPSLVTAVDLFSFIDFLPLRVSIKPKSRPEIAHYDTFSAKNIDFKIKIYHLLCQYLCNVPFAEAVCCELTYRCN